MILVDQQIKERIHQQQLLENFQESHITNIGYDLVIDQFTNHQQESSINYLLVPGDSVFVRTKESVNMPHDLAARIVLRNSRIRQGLSLDAPVYQPGHKTRIFFRVTNVSKSSIKLKQGDELASILFDKLEEEPDHPYEGAFQEEFDYRGMGTYGPQYSQQMQEIEDKMTHLKDLEKSSYGNVITLMTIFIGIFSLVNVNLTAAVSGIWSVKELLMYNLCIIGGIATLAGLVRVLVPTLSKKALSKCYWLIPILSFGVALFLELYH